MQTPTDITNRALEYVESVKADPIVSIGGEATFGLGKAITIRSESLHVSIPTAYTSSKMAPFLGETEHWGKITRSNPKIGPSICIYDLDLTITLPVRMSIISSIEAIAHSGKVIALTAGAG